MLRPSPLVPKAVLDIPKVILAFRRSYWQFRRSYWAFRRSYWTSRRSYWAFRRSYWQFRRSYWAFRRSYWSFRRSYWPFLWKIGRKIKELNERRTRKGVVRPPLRAGVAMVLPAYAPLYIFLFFIRYCWIFAFILTYFFSGFGCPAYPFFQILESVFLQFCRIGCFVQYPPRCAYFSKLIKQSIQQS